MSAAAMIIRRQNRIMRQFREARAVSRESAVSLDDIGVRRSWVLHRLAARGVLVDAGDGRLYLSEPAADAFVRNRRRRMLSFLLISIVVMLAVVFLAS